MSKFLLDEVGVQMRLFYVVDPPAAALRKGRGSLLNSFLEVRTDCESMIFLVNQFVLEFLLKVLLLRLEHLFAPAEIIAYAIDHVLDSAIKQL